MNTHCDILKLWPSLAELRRDLVGLGGDISTMGVVRWWQRDSIPGEWWADVERAAKIRGYDVSVEMMADIAALKRQGAA
jgi:hypothetical protein